MPKKIIGAGLRTVRDISPRGVIPINVVQGDNFRVGSIIHNGKTFIRMRDVSIAIGYSPSRSKSGGWNSKDASGKWSTKPFVSVVSENNKVKNPGVDFSGVNSGWFVSEKGALEVLAHSPRPKATPVDIKRLFKAARQQHNPKSDQTYTSATMSMGLAVKGVSLSSMIKSGAASAGVVLLRTHMSVLEYTVHHGITADRGERMKHGNALSKLCDLRGLPTTKVPSEHDKYSTVKGYPIALLDEYFKLTTTSAIAA